MTHPPEVVEAVARVLCKVAEIDEAWPYSPGEPLPLYLTMPATDLLDNIADRMVAGAVAIPKRLVPEVLQWIEDEQKHWPDDTPYQDDLAEFCAAIRAVQPENGVSP